MLYDYSTYAVNLASMHAVRHQGATVASIFQSGSYFLKYQICNYVKFLQIRSHIGRYQLYTASIATYWWYVM